jgi:ornithine cyclodeaminase/alanine dehydrogenase-like protein (mu-crystallin family)
MPLTILTDTDVRTILHSLTRNDILRLQDNLAEALHDYSLGSSDNGSCAANQPQRTVLNHTSGTTLFMPALSSASSGVKVVSLASPSSGRSTSPKGSLTLLDSAGEPVAFMNAEELTGFRTALAATLLFRRRTRVHSIAIFGAGKQAYWHIRLALLLRGKDIHHVRIINRSFARAEPLLHAIYSDESWKDLREANEKLDFSILSAEYGEYTRLLKEYVRDADALFCCTPSEKPLFPGEYLTSREGLRKGRYVSLIGSYKPDMCEVDTSILKRAVEPDHKNHHHKHAEKSGVVVVDGIEACLKEAGEIIQAGLTEDQLVEVGELIMVKKAVMREVEMGGKGEEGLKKWLFEGNVVYKSVGLGLMDLCVGEDIRVEAVKRGKGVNVDGF